VRRHRQGSPRRSPSNSTSFAPASITIRGIELAEKIKKAQFRVGQAVHQLRDSAGVLEAPTRLLTIREASRKPDGLHHYQIAPEPGGSVRHMHRDFQPLPSGRVRHRSSTSSAPHRVVDSRQENAAGSRTTPAESRQRNAECCSLPLNIGLLPWMPWTALVL